MERRLTLETNSILPFQKMTSSQLIIKEQRILAKVNPLTKRILAKNTQLTKRKGGATDFLDQNQRGEEASKMGLKEEELI